jgi:hypothetical protein
MCVLAERMLQKQHLPLLSCTYIESLRRKCPGREKTVIEKERISCSIYSTRD